MGTDWIPSSMSVHLHPQIRLLQDIGVIVEPELERDDLPVEILEKPDIRYATRLVWRFIQRIERREGISDLCYLGARNESIATMLPGPRDFLSVAVTLKEFLDRYAFAIRKYNGRHAKLSIRESLGLFEISSPISEADAPHQRFSDWSNILYTIRLMRMALGQTWSPAVISLQAKFKLLDEAYSDFPDSKIQTGAAKTAIIFPAKCLTTSMPEWQETLRTKRFHHAKLPEIGLFPDTLAGILRPYLSYENLSIELAAEAAGTSVRSLQRQLARYSLSYTSLVQRERISAACSQLETPGVSVTDIAYQLGFNNPTHFSRAFRKWTGRSPREFKHEKSYIA